MESNTELDGEEFDQSINSNMTVKSLPPVAQKYALVHAVWSDDRVISAFPDAPDGYNKYFDIATQNINVHLNTRISEFDIPRKRVMIDNVWHTYDIIVSTISPELLLNNAFGELRWMGRDFMKIVLPVPQVLPENIFFQYYANDEPFTRIVEYKKFYKYESNQTLLGIEIPSKSNKYYPYPTKRDQDIAKLYLDSLPPNVFSIGRAGSYRYIDMDDIIGQCFSLVKELS